MEKVLEHVEYQLTVSEIERDKFWFISLDISAVDDSIEIGLDDYMNSLKDIKDIRKTDWNEELTKLELNQYRTMTGTTSWLAYSAWPNSSYT